MRNHTIDILRALVMLLMVFVNNLWAIDGYPQWLGHSSAMEDYMGLSDIVFPCFLIIVGMSIPYAIEARFSKGDNGVDVLRHILNRWFALIIMGVFTVNSEIPVHSTVGMGTAWYRILMVVGFFMIWNLYPRGISQKSLLIPKIMGYGLLIFLAVTYRGGADDVVFRSSWWGILGIIGWVYLFSALLYLLVRSDMRWLIGVWGALVALCICGSIRQIGGTILDLPQPNFFDQMLSGLHINNGCETALAVSGIIITVLWQKRLKTLSSGHLLVIGVATAVVMLAAAVLTNQYFITSKIMSTAPWLFYNLSIICVAYSVIVCLERAHLTGWYRYISPAGSATLTCYIMPYIVYSIFDLTGYHVPEWLSTGWLGILYCIGFAFFIVLLTYLIGKLNIKLKV